MAKQFCLGQWWPDHGQHIWSMHFIAMMAVDFPILVNYNLLETIASICIAIVATGIGLYLASTHRLGV